MTQKEKEFFLSLCEFCAPDKEGIESCLDAGAATPEVLGMLFANRMAGIAYHVLEKCGLLGKADREFRNSLRNAALLNEKMNQAYLECVKALTIELDGCGVPYALLKGAYLCHWYPKGCRTSNDIDVLVSPDDVGKISAKLKEAGFRQGDIRNGVFTPATRRQIIESKMTRGETVPFMKEVKLPFMKYLEVDLNFSLDYKNSDDKTLKEMLARTEYRAVAATQIRTLDLYDFMLHLCSHLYKEATTIAWIRMKRDMTFYKYCDIYALLHHFTDDQFENLYAYASKNNLETELAYCLRSLKAFFSSEIAFEERIPVSADCLDHVFAPAEKKLYRYTVSDPAERFFEKDRIALLREVTV